MTKRKNIILLMTDQQRLDYTGYSGAGIIKTPNIDRIAESAGFTCCQTANPVCTPARTALITGRYTHQIGTLAMSGDLSLQIPTYMQALRKVGYHTSGIGKFHFLQTWKWSIPRGKGINLVYIKDDMKKFGFDYIWETSGKQLSLRNYCDYCEYMEQKGMLEAYRDFVESAGKNGDTPDKNYDNANPWPFDEKYYVDILTADKIIERIRQRPDNKPFYIFGSFCSPHKPYDPPKRYLDMVEYEENDNFIPGKEGKITSEAEKKVLYKQRRAAKAMVRLIDEQVGRIFTALEEEGLLQDTVILFTSDHGDMLGDHYRIQKGAPWKEASTVPLAIRHPDYLYKRKNRSPVEMIDLAATILEIAGIEPISALSKDWPEFNNIIPSRSLMPILRGHKDRIRDYTFTECTFKEDRDTGKCGNWQMIQTERWKYIRYSDYKEEGKPLEEFYDLVNDTNELTNLINNPDYHEAIQWCKERRDYVMDRTPPAQTKWASLM